MKEKIIRFMQGRYGHDSFNYFLLCLYFILVILAMLLDKYWLNYLGFICLLFSLFRALSKNYMARRQENQRFIKYSRPVSLRFKVIKRNLSDRERKYFLCPQCQQMVRVPRKRGKIEITCPSCHHHFTRRS